MILRYEETFKCVAKLLQKIIISIQYAIIIELGLQIKYGTGYYPAIDSIGNCINSHLMLVEFALDIRIHFEYNPDW